MSLLAVHGAVPRSSVRREPDRVNILGVGVMPLDVARAVDLLERWRSEGRRDYVCCVSVHGLVTAQRDPAVREAINRAGLAIEDGMPLVWWSRRYGFPAALRVCGSDLLEAMCRRTAGSSCRHYFYGGSPRVLDLLVTRLAGRFPGLVVAGHHSPPFRPLTEGEDVAEIAAINASCPDYVWVGLGMPKQEKWMAAHVGHIAATALIGVGAAFDFHAGTKPRAPHWMQRSGLEWLFRLATEPRRLAHRYLVDNMIFLVCAARQLAGWRSHARDC
jgi:N-acetylglucosaminyldiphosphoundecaprenol N-acetyl-beta-D-mannosaminyltransferase